MSELRDLDDSDKKAGEIASSFSKLVAKGGTLAIQAGAANPAHAALIATQGASSCLHLLARCIGDPNQVSDGPLTSQMVLFAALLAYRANPLETAYGTSKSEFGPNVLAEALADYKKFTGQDPDEWLRPDVVGAARLCDAAMLADISRRRAMAEAGADGDRTLN